MLHCSVVHVSLSVAAEAVSCSPAPDAQWLHGVLLLHAPMYPRGTHTTYLHLWCAVPVPLMYLRGTPRMVCLCVYHLCTGIYMYPSGTPHSVCLCVDHLCTGVSMYHRGTYTPYVFLSCLAARCPGTQEATSGRFICTFQIALGLL